MTDPNVRKIGEVEDIDGMTIAVGVDYDTVALYIGGWLTADGVRLDFPQRAALRTLLDAADMAANQADPDR